jgi:hypothetical protein
VTTQRIVLPALALGLAIMTGHACAFELERDWPSVEVAPALDVPMRDTAITRAPGGMYYLTGTLQGEGPTGQADFDNGRQIRLWRSADLKNWSEVGVVWDLEKPQGKYERYAWMRQAHKDPGRADSPVCWGIRAPEMHLVKGDWYICFSMNGQGTGLLKSTSGKPEGPYEAWAQITLRHGDPTIFWDEKDAWGGDGAVYWLFGGGWIARMGEDLSALADTPHLLTASPQQPPHYARGKAPVWRDYPLTAGDHGVFLFKHRGRYYLTAAERTNRMNASCDDTYVAWSDTLMGPYSDAFLMVPHGGGVTVFRGPRSSAVPKYYYPQQAFFRQSVSRNAKPVEEIEKAKTDDTLYTTFYGNDDRAIFRDRPSFLPLEWTGPERCVERLFDDCESFPRRPRHVFTERGPWSRMVPQLPDENVRDIKVCAAPNGEYFFSGAAISHPGKLMVWKSTDLARWQELPPIWTYEQIEWLDPKLPMPTNAFPANPKGDNAWEHIFWHSWLTYWNGTFYATYCIFRPKDDKLAHLRGTGALKSTSGKIEGPWVSLGKVGGHVGYDPVPSSFSFFEYRGDLYVSDSMNWKLSVARADLEAPGWKGWDWKPVEADAYGYMQRGDGYSVGAFLDVPVFSFHSSGRLDGKERLDSNTYDHNFAVMKDLTGPVIGKPFNVPHVMASNIFRDHKGYWWSSMFGTDSTAPWYCRFGLVPLRVEKRGPQDLFIDVEMKPDDYQLKIAGAGRIAEVLTVQQTLP